jgi:outer membrane protein TolC
LKISNFESRISNRESGKVSFSFLASSEVERTRNPMKLNYGTWSVALIVSVAASLCALLAVSSTQAQIISLAPPTQGGPQNPLLGGIPAGTRSSGTLSLSIKDTIERGLRYNLGIALGGEDIDAARAARLRALSNLLPRVAIVASESEQQVNLAALGFTGLPGVPAILGPFPVFDARAHITQSILNLSDREALRAGTENLNAARNSYKNTRELVVLVCLQLYMQAVAGNSRIEANEVQLKTAQTLYDLAVSRKSAGFIPGIEVLRAQVQMQAQQQRLIVARNDFAKQKLKLAQAIGLPLGQDFQLTDQMSFAPMVDITVEGAEQDAYRNRGDYQSAMAQVRAAEDERRSVARLSAPSMNLNADYGDIGQHPTSSHGTFSVSLSLRIPVFQGREVEAMIMSADARLAQQKAELESLRARVYYEIQSALLDIKSAEERVQVAKSNLELANQQVAQAQDRFSLGIESNIEVVQAQDALATATEDYISSLYAQNIAKVYLAQAMGMAEAGYDRFLRGK